MRLTTPHVLLSTISAMSKILDVVARQHDMEYEREMQNCLPKRARSLRSLHRYPAEITVSKDYLIKAHSLAPLWRMYLRHNKLQRDTISDLVHKSSNMLSLSRNQHAASRAHQPNRGPRLGDMHTIRYGEEIQELTWSRPMDDFTALLPRSSNGTSPWDVHIKVLPNLKKLVWNDEILVQVLPHLVTKDLQQIIVKHELDQATFNALLDAVATIDSLKLAWFVVGTWTKALTSWDSDGQRALQWDRAYWYDNSPKRIAPLAKIRFPNIRNLDRCIGHRMTFFATSAVLSDDVVRCLAEKGQLQNLDITYNPTNEIVESLESMIKQGGRPFEKLEMFTLRVSIRECTATLAPFLCTIRSQALASVFLREDYQDFPEGLPADADAHIKLSVELSNAMTKIQEDFLHSSPNVELFDYFVLRDSSDKFLDMRQLKCLMKYGTQNLFTNNGSVLTHLVVVDQSLDQDDATLRGIASAFPALVHLRMHRPGLGEVEDITFLGVRVLVERCALLSDLAVGVNAKKWIQAGYLPTPESESGTAYERTLFWDALGSDLPTELTEDILNAIVKCFPNVIWWETRPNRGMWQQLFAHANGRSRRVSSQVANVKEIVKP